MYDTAAAPQEREPDALRAVATLLGCIVLPMLLIVLAALFTAALLGDLVNT